MIGNVFVLASKFTILLRCDETPDPLFLQQNLTEGVSIFFISVLLVIFSHENVPQFRRTLTISMRLFKYSRFMMDLMLLFDEGVLTWQFFRVQVAGGRNLVLLAQVFCLADPLPL